MKMGQAFSKEWARRTAERASSSNEGARASYSGSFGQRQQQQGAGAGAEAGADARSMFGPGGAPQWALDELGLGRRESLPSLAEAKAMYRQRAMACHPDSAGPGADPEAFKRVSKAWAELQSHLR